MKLFEEGVGFPANAEAIGRSRGPRGNLLKKADGKLAAEPFEPEGESNA